MDPENTTTDVDASAGAGAGTGEASYPPAGTPASNPAESPSDTPCAVDIYRTPRTSRTDPYSNPSPPSLEEREQQLALQAAMKAAVEAAGATSPSGKDDGTTPGGVYTFKDGRLVPSCFGAPEEVEAQKSWHVRGDGELISFSQLVVEDARRITEAASGRRCRRPAKVSFGNEFGGISGCKDMALVQLFRQLCNELPEDCRINLFRIGGMYACNLFCYELARYMLGYDRAWWQRLLGLGRPTAQGVLNRVRRAATL